MPPTRLGETAPARGSSEPDSDGAGTQPGAAARAAPARPGAPRQAGAGPTRGGRGHAQRGRREARDQPDGQPALAASVQQLVENDEAFLNLERRRVSALEELVALQRADSERLARLSEAVLQALRR